jgi:hypothetical protein
MADTWSGTSNNQLVTFNAFLDAWGVVLRPKGSAPTGSKEIVTKADVESFVYIDTANSYWTALSSNQCPTKEDIFQAAFYDALFFARKQSTPSDSYDITIEHKRAGSTIQTKTATINNTLCGSLDAKIEFINTSGTNALRYNDTLVLTVYYAGTGTAIELKISTTAYDCGTENYASCGDTYTVNTRIRRSYQPKSYVACV